MKRSVGLLHNFLSLSMFERKLSNPALVNQWLVIKAHFNFVSKKGKVKKLSERAYVH